MADDLHGQLMDSAVAYLDRVQGVLRVLPIEVIGQFLELVLKARAEGRTVFVFGNGGSAATASHVAVDFGKTALRPGWPPLRAVALNDNVPLLTAWANDADYSRVFAEQLRTLGRTGDIALAISGSGNSPNVVAAVEAARELGLFTVAFLGFDGGRVRNLVDLAIVVPSFEYGPVEDIHMVLNHLVTAVMNEMEFGRLDKAVESLRVDGGSAALGGPAVGAAGMLAVDPLAHVAAAPSEGRRSPETEAGAL